MNKDVLFTIYEIVHRDLTKQLNTEYFQKLAHCTFSHNNNICTCSIAIKHDYIYKKAYNYRYYIGKWMCVYTKWENAVVVCWANY